MKVKGKLSGLLVVGIGLQALVGQALDQSEVKSDAERLVLIRPVAEGVLDLRPTFVSCSVEFGSAAPIPDLRLEYREKGAADGKILTGVDLVHLPRTRDYRVSLLGLKEDTAYDVRLTAGGKLYAEGTFRTWKSEVPVAETKVLDPVPGKCLVISDVGSPEGWIRYVLPKGRVLDLGEGEGEECIRVKGARYVLFDDLCIRGSRCRRVFNVTDSRFVRFRNCEISRWGRTGVPRFDHYGRLFDPRRKAEGYGINFDAAIEIGRGTFGCVVERCWIHDPRGRANSWFYSHPAGPEAVLAARPEGGTVIRWCDFTGSDVHRWNDAVESAGNFFEDGGFNRDADVDGNFMIFANDDCIELDGGQRNVRCFGNRFESALCGVSVQGCMVSPSYVRDNLFSGMCGEFGESGQTLKTGGGAHGPDARCYMEDNVFWGPGDGVMMMEMLNAVVRRNVFCDSQKISKTADSPRSVLVDNVRGRTLEESALDPAYPRRPTGFSLDRARFSGIRVARGAATPACVRFTAKGGPKPVPFAVVQNDVFDWFQVEPSSGVIPAGEEVAFTVTFLADQMKDRHDYRGCFLVRTHEGLSRPVSLYAETDFVPPYRPTLDGKATAVYHPDFTEGTFRRLAPKGGCGRFEFDVPKDGRYYFMIHSRNRLELKVAVDDDVAGLSRQQNRSHPTWTMLTPGRRFGNMCRHYDLKAGRHVVCLEPDGGAPEADGLVLTDDPLAFEPR